MSGAKVDLRAIRLQMQQQLKQQVRVLCMSLWVLLLHEWVPLF